MVLEFAESLQQGTLPANVFETGLNTLKSIFMITAVLYKIRMRHPYLSSRCIAMDEAFTQFAVRWINELDSPCELKYLLSEKNLDGESVLDLITFQEKIDIFMMEPVQNFITTLWEGPFEIERNFETISKNAAIMGSFLRQGTAVDKERFLRCRKMTVRP